MMITYKAFAKKRNKRSNEILQLIEAGRIAGAVQDAQAKWMVPDGALIDYKPRQKKSPTISDHVFDILRALNGGYNVNAEILGMSPRLYEGTVTSMVDGGLLRRDQEPTEYDSGLSLTMKGMEMARKGKRDYSKLYRVTLAGIAEGATRSQS